MMMCAGIDLVAKFHAGTDKNGVGPRFRAFINAYFSGIPLNDAEVVFQFRNALLHSFGLYARDNHGNEYKFGIAPESKLANYHNDSKYIINAGMLYTQFETALQQYRNDLATNDDLRSKFQSMFLHYGTTELRLNS
jgi:hypothetical protein